jgi:hypothetical protein
MSNQIKVAELTGAKLAEWVARAQVWRIETDEGEIVCYEPQGGVHSFGQFGYRPDLNWAEGGAIIERERIELHLSGGEWYAQVQTKKWNGADGKTALIAAMRAFVASVYGDTVPDEAQA